MHLDVSTRRNPLPMLLALLAVPLWLFTACSEGESVDDDDATAADDDAGDDDAGDDDMWADDDDAADDDAAGDDDDDSAGDPCTVEVGPPGMQLELAGTCEDDPGLCEGGYDVMNSGGSCGNGLTCCIHDDQCESVFMGTCVATQDDCDSELPPDVPEFPEMGCPLSDPVCCVPGPPQ